MVQAKMNISYTQVICNGTASICVCIAMIVLATVLDEPIINYSLLIRWVVLFVHYS